MDTYSPRILFFLPFLLIIYAWFSYVFHDLSESGKENSMRHMQNKKQIA